MSLEGRPDSTSLNQVKLWYGFDKLSMLNGRVGAGGCVLFTPFCACAYNTTPGCLAGWLQVKMLQGMSEDLAKFYVASIILALDYLHGSHTVYRDLKPENVFIDSQVS